MHLQQQNKQILTDLRSKNNYITSIKDKMISVNEEYEKQIAENIKNRVPLSEEEAQKEIAKLQEYPMFMTELPEHPEENVYLQSFQALQYEGNADEVGLDFLKSSKENLEKYKKSKKFNDLKESMIDICNAVDHCENDPICKHISNF